MNNNTDDNNAILPVKHEDQRHHSTTPISNTSIPTFRASPPKSPWTAVSSTTYVSGRRMMMIL